ncbi:Ubiquitin fusion degradation protein 1-like [Hondaea fermentalgiana]|uniref:Ubiquitin fusion degradation protein 1-like n=1 Tax=Hondaea fermentalgiana TaxID=2315210 RepID=A0A2R5GS05_9STRA|nr:Ubiquitin fusion degradation protein 1-like [Hondaea fermentalgiana]|eukprot:GBG33667.1 Ubiquitin fusion degradation protein 1-like [Hondaea fermentalgiana]
MSRLYPGWGSGKNGKLEEALAVFPVATLDRADLEAGDKVILPQSMFRTVSRLRLPFPLTFEVTNPRIAKLAANAATNARPGRQRAPIHSAPTKKTGPNGAPAQPKLVKGVRKTPPTVPKQFCGVMEFSGPEGKAFIPHWMMRNLRLKESQKATFRTVPKDSLPRGTLCRLQPHTTAFIDLAASMDLRELLEHAFRNYSVLSTGETLVVNVAGENFKINVVETQPEPAISLYGNLDLEVDFAPPLDQPDVGKMRPSSRERANPADTSTSDVNTDVDAQLASLAQQALATVSNAALSSLAAGTAAGTGTNNQVSSPAENGAPKAHVWGAGRSINGASTTVTPETAAPQTTTETASAPQPRARRRKPSRFAQRTAGSSFVGQASTVDAADAESARDQDEAQTTATQQFTPFTGPGRRLVSAGQDPAIGDESNANGDTDAETRPKPTRESLRERRMRFLENLEKQANRAKTPEGEADDAAANSIAVGSSLNAIRKQKTGAKE